MNYNLPSSVDHASLVRIQPLTRYLVAPLKVPTRTRLARCETVTVPNYSPENEITANVVYFRYTQGDPRSEMNFATL